MLRRPPGDLAIAVVIDAWSSTAPISTLVASLPRWGSSVVRFFHGDRIDLGDPFAEDSKGVRFRWLEGGGQTLASYMTDGVLVTFG